MSKDSLQYQIEYWKRIIKTGGYVSDGRRKELMKMKKELVIMVLKGD